MTRYALTVFVSAFLLFQVQPLIARFVLPWFGGGPAIWTTCMLFFQTLLLGGYLYAHVVSQYLTLKRQGLVHMGLLVVSLVCLPIAPSDAWKPNGGETPVVGILLLLLVTVGGPYFLLSSTGPLLQRWFSHSFPDRSPYRLYSLSNVGSMLALLSYPFLFEPTMRLQGQVFMWSGIYAVFVAMTSWCGWVISRMPDPRSEQVRGSLGSQPDVEPDANSNPPPAPLTLLLWLGLSAAGSATLLATTNQMCLDVAVVPFLWVVPLSLYLLSFVICFDNPRWYDRRVFGTLLLLAAAGACWQLDQGLDTSIPMLICIYSGVMFAVCMACHGELVRSRPDSRYLTLFYLLVSAGGALGGVFVAIGAPLWFTGFWEYPISLVAAVSMCLLSWNLYPGESPRYSLSPWIWMAVSLLQVGLLYRWTLGADETALFAEDIALLFTGWVVIHLVGWVLTADRDRSEAALLPVWLMIVLVSVGWLAAVARWREIEVLTTNLICKLLFAWLAMTAIAWACHWGAARLIRRGHRMALSVVVAQLVTLVMLGGAAWLELVSAYSIAVLGLTFLILTLCALGMSGFRSRRWAESQTWMWGPAAAIVLLFGVSLSLIFDEDSEDTLFTSRNFYGVLRVSKEVDNLGEYYSLTHGQIEHGIQYLDEAWRMEPTSYYGFGTGVELAFRYHPRRLHAEIAQQSLRIGVIGLGTGSIASHGRAGDLIRFYEINPEVVALSETYFTYLRDTPAKVEVALGDARVMLEREGEADDWQQFDLLAVDAFSSDAIPIHLITRECAQLYQRHLKPDGLLLIHISNRYLDLNPITRALAEQLKWGAVRIENDDNDELGVYGSTWVILTANQEFLEHPEIVNAHWPWSDDEQPPLLWTDDFASLWQIITE